MSKPLRILVIFLILGALAFFLLGPPRQKSNQPSAGKKLQPAPAAVETAPVLHQQIELRQSFSGTLEPQAEFVVAPKVPGRILQLNVNIGDFVERNEVVGELDSDEYVQAVTRAKADLAVARANLAEARSSLTIADRELARVETLRGRGVSSESQLDTAKANQLTKQVGLNVAQAELVYAEAGLETANLHLGYTKISAGWSGGKNRRVVAERFVDEGELVAVNSPLLRIVELDPIVGVVYVSERDYALMQPGQPVALTTDAYPGETFSGRIDRIAPVFNEATRQARVELSIANPDLRLKPGMFIRVNAVLDRHNQATVVPEPALTTRNGQPGVFVVTEDGGHVRWQPVTTGIQESGLVEITDVPLSGKVVTLGQQLLEDGSAITIPEPPEPGGK